MFNSKQIIWGCWRQWGFWHEYPQSECDVTHAVIFSSYMHTAGCSPAGACFFFFHRGVLWKLSHRLDPSLLSHTDSVRYKHVSLIKRLYRSNLACECVNPFFISRVLTASSATTDNRTARQPDFEAKCRIMILKYAFKAGLSFCTRSVSLNLLSLCLKMISISICTRCLSLEYPASLQLWILRN